MTHDVLCDLCGERPADDSIPGAIDTPLCEFCREKDCLDAARDYEMITGLNYAVAAEDLKRRREAACFSGSTGLSTGTLRGIT